MRTGKTERLVTVCLWGILLSALFLRLNNIDHGAGFHPDERAMVMVVSGLSWENLNPKSFAYGSFPYYLTWFSAQCIGKLIPSATSYDGLFVMGRTLAALSGVLTVFFTFLLGKLLFSSQLAAVSAAALLAWNPLHIQLSRFFTVDVFLVLFCTYLFLCLVDILAGKVRSGYILAGITIGLGAATKISALSLLLPFLLVHTILFFKRQKKERRFFAALLFPLHGVLALAVALAVVSTLGSGIWGVSFVWIFTGALVIVALPVILAPLFRRFFWRAEVSPGLLYLFSLTLLALLGSFFVFEPYAFFDFDLFRHQLLEQLRMVAGEWRPPYTQQFVGTLPWLYPLEQILRYTMGPVIGGLALIAFAWSFVQGLRQRRSAFLVIWVWALVYFLFVGSSFVKFPRYLLPIYPVLFLTVGYLVAQFLSWSRVRKSLFTCACVVTIGIGVAAAFQAGAWASVYASEHGYKAASRWLYENLPKDSRIAMPHWDDRLPVALPGYSPNNFSAGQEPLTLPIYEPDSPAKLFKMAEVLNKADYVAFATNRILLSVPRNPDKYPLSRRFLALLFDGRLGYTLERTFKARPGLFGVELIDDGANESFTSYDHPRISLLKKTHPVAADEIVRRIENVASFPVEERAYSTIARVQAAESPEDFLSVSNSVVSALQWLLVLGVCTVLFFPLLAVVFPERKAWAGALSLVGGPFLFAGASWLAMASGYFSPQGALSFSFIVLFAAAGMLAPGTIAAFRSFPIRELMTMGGLFLLSFVLFAVARSFHPEIFWGEKPMDFSFLNYFIRLDHFPPIDPWVAGEGMNYYYFGSWTAAVLHRLSGVDSAFGYNLMLATLAGFLSVAVFAALRSFRLGLLYSFTAGLLFLFLGNGESFQLSFLSDRTWNFDLFWATTRLFSGGNWSEYPLWSLLFGDLHAHVIARPLFLLLLPFSMSLFLTPERKQTRWIGAESLLFGLLAGILFLVNGWDFIAFGVFSFCVGIVALCQRERPFRKRLLSLFLKAACAAAVAALFVFLHMMAFSKGGMDVFFGWHRGEMNHVGHIFRHLGFFIPPLIIFLFVLLFSSAHRPTLQKSIFALLVPLLFLIGVGLWYWLSTEQAPPFSVFSFGAALLIAGAFVWSEKTQKKSFFAPFLLFAGFFIALCEVSVLADRMNTIFKFYLSLWDVLALVALAFTGSLFLWTRKNFDEQKFRGKTLALGSAAFLASIVIVLSVMGGVSQLLIMLDHQRVDGPRPTLNGLAYRERFEKSEYRVAQWIQRNVPGTPVLLEAHGPSYREFSRMSMLTGLPIVLGWEHHVWQRGASREEIRKRKEAIRRMYETPNLEEARTLLRDYGVKYIFVGDLERRTYSPAGLRKFQSGEFFKKRQQQATAVLYEFLPGDATL